MRPRLLVLALFVVPAASCSLSPDVGDLRAARVAAGGSGGSGGSGGGTSISFARDIRPLMNREDDDPNGHGCKHCHYPGVGTQEGLMATQLDLSTLGALRRGGVTATPDKIVVAGQPETSALVQKLEGTYFNGSRMPKSGPPFWSDQEIQLVKDWITQGAMGGDDE